MKRVSARAGDMAPIIWGATSGQRSALRAIANGLNEAGIPTARGHGKWSAVQVSRLLDVISDKQTKREIKTND